MNGSQTESAETHKKRAETDQDVREHCESDNDHSIRNKCKEIDRKAAESELIVETHRNR